MVGPPNQSGIGDNCFGCVDQRLPCLNLVCKVLGRHIRCYIGVRILIKKIINYETNL